MHIYSQKPLASCFRLAFLMIIRHLRRHTPLLRRHSRLDAAECRLGIAPNFATVMHHARPREPRPRRVHLAKLAHDAAAISLSQATFEFSRK